ncbi:hypothetical protein REIP_1785 [Rickettsia endosymbiont of Ixodes pacificus]|uniref:hypothetical protein n=1 Tax=Rickettsia endosymbiont of Ixodes pacificus TaxID=1133329 RepID=UPI0005F7A496|nr:hypothetical protein [Rickettsia endosymbiont of Ixodes pacificus]KJW01803.1 hypothetical protein REIP_1785 [Rickettsia endosymbiont of Ixodes pacificus]
MAFLIITYLFQNIIWYSLHTTIPFYYPSEQSRLDWDYEKTRVHVYGLIEGMKISSIYGPRNIEAFQWDRSVLEYGLPHDITFQLIQDNSLMKNFVSLLISNQ